MPKTFAQLPAITTTTSADKVPIWDDSGNVAAHITIANLTTEILGGTSGILLADGSVSMTGNFNLASTNLLSNDVDSVHLMGRAAVGYDGSGTDKAVFAHRDFMAVNQAALAQHSNGSVVITTPSGQSFSINVGTDPRLSMDIYGKVGVGVDADSPDALLHVRNADLVGAQFSGDTYFIIENSGSSYMQIIAGGSEAGINFGDTGNARAGSILYDHTNERLVFHSDGGSRFAMYNNRLAPDVDNAYDLGSTGQRYDDIYATNSTIQTSDGQQKKRVQESALGLDFINELRPVSYQWKSSPGRKAKKALTQKSSDRTHYGLIAQDVKSVLDKLSIDSQHFAGYIEDDGAFGLRYNEFIAPIVKAIQELNEQVKELQNG